MYYIIFFILFANNSLAMDRIFGKKKSSKNLVSEPNSFEKKHDKIIEQVRTKIWEVWIKKRAACNDITPLAQLFLLDDNAFKNCGPNKQNESINIGIAFINQMMNEGLLSLGSVYDLLHHVQAGRDKSSQDWQYTMFDAAVKKIETFLEKYATVEQVKKLIKEVHKTDNNVIGRTVPFFMCHDSARYIDLFTQKQQEKGWDIDAVKSLNEELLSLLKTINYTDYSREVFLIRYAYFLHQLPKDVATQLPILNDMDTNDIIKEYIKFLWVFGVEQSQGEREYQEDHFDLIGDPKNGYFSFFVFDGHSATKDEHGREVAALASKKLGKALYKAIIEKSAKHIDQAIFDAFQKINAKITSDPKFDKVGSTVAGVLIRLNEKKLYAINCGDSRVVLASNDPVEGVADSLVVQDLTVDHNHKNDEELKRIVTPSALDALRKKRLAKRQGEIQSPLRARARGKLNEEADPDFDIDSDIPLNKKGVKIEVTRALGDKYFHPQLVGTAEVKEHDLSDKDSFVLLMTDGVYRNVQRRLSAPIYKSFRSNSESSNYALAKLCAELLTKGKTPLAAAQECIKDRLTDDNATIIVLDLKKLQEKMSKTAE